MGFIAAAIQEDTACLVTIATIRSKSPICLRSVHLSTPTDKIQLKQKQYQPLRSVYLCTEADQCTMAIAAFNHDIILRMFKRSPQCTCLAFADTEY